MTENNTLFAHRSRTGFCIFRIDFKEDSHHVVTVNNDPGQYGHESIEDSTELLTELLYYWTESPYDRYNEWISETYDALKKKVK